MIIFRKIFISALTICLNSYAYGAEIKLEKKTCSIGYGVIRLELIVYMI